MKGSVFLCSYSGKPAQVQILDLCWVPLFSNYSLADNKWADGIDFLVEALEQLQGESEAGLMPNHPFVEKVLDLIGDPQCHYPVCFPFTRS